MIVFDIEDTFGIEIPYNANEEAADFKTVGSVVERVRALIDGLRRGRRQGMIRGDHGLPAPWARQIKRISLDDMSGGPRRVVVTGMGVVTPIGTTVADFWAGCRRAQVGVGPIDGFDIEDLKILIAAQIKDFDHKARLKHFKRDKIILHADRYSWFAAAAADEAIKHGRPRGSLQDPLSRRLHHRVGRRRPADHGSRLPRPVHQEEARHPSADAAAHHRLVRRRPMSASSIGVKGPTFATCSACSTAAHAIGIGSDYIRHGLVDMAIVGASESVISYGMMRAWQAMHVLSPEGIFPFAKKRNGTVLGEGAGILVLESLAHAKARGAKMLAEVWASA